MFLYYRRCIRISVALLFLSCCFQPGTGEALGELCRIGLFNYLFAWTFAYTVVCMVITGITASAPLLKFCCFVDLLQAVGLNRSVSAQQPEGVRSTNIDGVVEFNFRDPYLYQPARQVFPDGVPLKFAIMAEFLYRKDSDREEYLFSLNRAADAGVVLGLSVQENQVSFTYTDPNGRPEMSPKFSAALMGGVWTTVLLTVEKDTVAFYFNCNKKPSAQQALGRTTPPVRLQLDGNLYVGRKYPNRKKQVNMDKPPLVFRVSYV